MGRKKITVGMAHYADFDGVFFTIQALRLYHDMEDCEVLIIDNDPDSPYGEEVKGFVRNANTSFMPIRHIPFTENQGTTQTRQRIFDHAEGELVLVMDCHVMLYPNAIARLKRFYDAADEDMRKNMFTGPLLMDQFDYQMTHFEPEWRSEMWGTWACAWQSPEGDYFVGKNQDNQLWLKMLNTEGPWSPTGLDWAGHESGLRNRGYKMAGWDFEDPPFEVPAQGLGLFCSAKDHWLGFNPHFRSFGGEECYIHEKYRQHGRKTMCLPFLKWNHRFGRPGGPKYPITVEGKMRNYILGFQELKLDIEPVRHHFVDEVGVPPAIWDYAVQDPINFDPTNNPFRKQHPNTFLHNQLPTSTSNLGLPLPLVIDSLQTIALFLQTNPRDLDQHAPVLIELASRCESITEITKRRESTAFLLAGITRKKPCSEEKCNSEKCEKKTCNRQIKNVRMITFQEERDTLIGLLHESVKTSPGRPLTWTEHEANLDTMPELTMETDMLFLDTRHTGTRAYAELTAYSPLVKRYIVFHDTALYGQTGEDGQPGLLDAIRRFIKEQPQWFIASHNPEQYGLTVLSCNEEDRPESPIRPWPPNCGPGTELKRYLKKIGIEATPNCRCNSRALQMDIWGPALCREKIEEILDWLKEESEARQMGHLYVRPAVKIMVYAAIRAAEKKIAKGECET